MGKVSSFPFAADSDFQVLLYTLSHRELRLSSDNDRAFEQRIEICFEGVERMELDERFTGGLTITPVNSHGDLDNGAAVALLLLELAGGTFGSGFVACAKITARRFRREGNEAVFDRVLFWAGAIYSPHAVGGRPAEPGEVAFGLPVLHRYSPEKRTTARFPPPRQGRE